MTGWVIIEDPSTVSWVLRHPSGARAYFSQFAVGDLMMRHHMPRLPRDPFQALAWLINNGLKPYRVDGDMPVGAIPAQANVEPQLLAQTRLLDSPR